MITTTTIKCKLKTKFADELNTASARIYNSVMVEHWRVFRKHGLWLHKYQATKYNNRLVSTNILHSHSKIMAQHAFYKAAKTTKALKKSGDKETRYPHKVKRFRTTMWDVTGIRQRGGFALLSLAKGKSPICIKLPKRLQGSDIRIVQLKYNESTRHYEWKLAIDDGKQEPEIKVVGETASIDMGEIHPVAIGTENASVIILCRELRANNQYRNKQQASISRKQSGLVKYSRKWKQLQARKNRVLAKTEARQTDMLHKVSRATVKWAEQNDVNKIVFGDIRNISNRTKKEKRLGRKSRQKISNWPHGQLKQYIEYKAKTVGIDTDLQSEHYTSKTCCYCGTKNNVRGRVYKCKSCKETYHRDIGGQANILSLYKYKKLSQVRPTKPKYRLPFDIRIGRSSLDTGQVVL